MANNKDIIYRNLMQYKTTEIKLMEDVKFSNVHLSETYLYTLDVGYGYVVRPCARGCWVHLLPLLPHHNIYHIPTRTTLCNTPSVMIQIFRSV